MIDFQWLICLEWDMNKNSKEYVVMISIHMFFNYQQKLTSSK